MNHRCVRTGVFASACFLRYTASVIVLYACANNVYIMCISYICTHDFPFPLRHLRTSVRILQTREVGAGQDVVAVVIAFADAENALKVARRSWTDYYFICGYCTNSVLETFTMALRCCYLCDKL